MSANEFPERTSTMRFRQRPLYYGVISIIVLLCSCHDKLATPGKTPEALCITAETFSIYSGGTLQLSATAQYSDGTTGDVTSDAFWSIRPGRAGRINETGLFVAYSDITGTETVRADYQGQADSVEIEVTLGARFLEILPRTISIDPGEEVQFEAVVEYEDETREYATDKILWSVSPGTAGTIDSTGLFRSNPQTTGTEKVTGSYQNLTATARVTVGDTMASLFDMVTIPAGSFIMGDDNGYVSEKPAHDVYIDAFEISKYEVTNQQYVDYLNRALADGAIVVSMGIVTGRTGPFATLTYFMFHTCPEFPNVFIEYVQMEDDDYEFQVRPGFEDYPVVRLNWYGAAAFCQYYGLRLPTEAEWEKACRGGQQLEYGTQDGSISHDLANFLGTGERDVYQGLAPVGSFPPNPYGLYDMCGNAAEYVFDAYDRNYYYRSPAENPTGPGPAVVTGRLLNEVALWRGGSWASYPFLCRSAYRGVVDDYTDCNYLAESIFGFRVARSLH